MKSKLIFMGLIVSIALAGVCSQAVRADNVTDAIVLAADGLVANQTALPDSQAGSWPGETGFTGSILPGLLAAYKATGNPDYMSAAELAADYIIGAGYPGNFYGDEAYALTQMSEFSVDPSNNYWRTIVKGFYEWIRTHADGGTQGYIDAYYSGTNPSTAVFYLSYHVMAAYYVNATDKAIWRNGLRKMLTEVYDDGLYKETPVMALGVAVWALAQTGSTPLYLDNSLVRGVPGGQPYWTGMKMKDLPGELLSHQVTSGPYAGTFYWRFDHLGPAPVDGFTEDMVYGVLGLEAADKADPTTDYSAALCAAKAKLPMYVYSGGTVYDHLNDWAVSQYHFAGELLQALGVYKLVGDLDDSGCVDMVDLQIMASHWLATGCTWNSCDGADMNHDGTVDLQDFAVLANNWLSCAAGAGCS